MSWDTLVPIALFAGLGAVWLLLVLRTGAGG
jgi:hypothetical protein